VTLAEPIRESKRRLRRKVQRALRALEPAGRAAQEARLRAKLETLPGFAEARVLALYEPGFPEEIDTRAVAAQLLKAGRRLVYPRLDVDSERLRLFNVTDPAAQLRPGAFGIPEPIPGCPEADPEAVDWMLVPGLAFDRRGRRLGRGGGHYDRLLPTLRPDAGRWSIALKPQLVIEVPLEAHDQPIDGVLFPDLLVESERGRRK